jgi:hypothetical protein
MGSFDSQMSGKPMKSLGAISAPMQNNDHLSFWARDLGRPKLILKA